MKLVLIGAGNRITYQYALNLDAHFASVVQILGIFDKNKGRSELLASKLTQKPRVYTDPQTMIETERPDTVLIGSIDSTHDEYIELAMALGCDVICEKPITTTYEKAVRIRKAQETYGKKITITFNYRFTFFASRMKELLASGIIGDVRTVHFEWLLDRSHGADYFRRWHRVKANSGGLAVHKCTHHFDLVNWLLDSRALRVYGTGNLLHYGAKNSPFSGTNCRTCQFKDRCSFYKDYQSDSAIPEMYYANEEEDGYLRDGCVFSPEIDIEDTLSALVHYENGAVMTYTMLAYSPYEGYRLSITGSKGRMEAEDFHGLVGPYKNEQIYRLRIFNEKEEIVEYKIPSQTGSHGGGDDRMMKMLFSGQKLADPLGQMASMVDGFNSVLIGIALNKSMEEKRVIDMKEFEGAYHG